MLQKCLFGFLNFPYPIYFLLFHVNDDPFCGFYTELSFCLLKHIRSLTKLFKHFNSSLAPFRHILSLPSDSVWFVCCRVAIQSTTCQVMTHLRELFPHLKLKFWAIQAAVLNWASVLTFSFVFVFYLSVKTHRSILIRVRIQCIRFSQSLTFMCCRIWYMRNLKNI